MEHDASPVPIDVHDDTLGGLDGSPNLASGGASSNGAFARDSKPRQSYPQSHHQQTQSLDQGLSSQSPHPEDMEARYNTPPIPQQMGNPNSRPASSMSGHQYPNDGQHRVSAPSAASNSGGAEQPNGRNHVVIKVGMVGDAQIGKTSLMVKYVEGSWDEDYIQTLGVNFMEKTISIRNTEITFSIWDLGGQREFVNMLPLVCNDAVAILFMFDLTRKSTLNSIKEWYRQGRGFNKTAIPILVGTKYDHFVNFPREDQEEISNQVCSICKPYFVRV
jgi:Gtp-binding protein of the ras superfamily involved in termination of M-phase